MGQGPWNACLGFAIVHLCVATMAQHWKAEDFIQEVDHLERLRHLQPQTATVQSCVNTLVKKVTSVEWTSKGMVQMMERLQTSSLTEEAKTRLADGLAKANQTMNTHLKMVCLGQAVHNMSQYLTMIDWKILKDPMSPMVNVMATLAKRLKHMGVTSMKEVTKKTCVALVLWANHLNGKAFLTAPAMYQMSQDMTRIFQATAPVVDGAESLANYPTDPKELEKAYQGQEQPAFQAMNLEAYVAKVTCWHFSTIILTLHFTPFFFSPRIHISGESPQHRD